MNDRLRELRSKLTEKQALFAEHYASNGGNGTQAARSAGYAEPETADGLQLRVQAAQNLTVPNVVAYLGELVRPENTQVQRRLLSVQDRLEWLTRVIDGEKLFAGKEGELTRSAPAIVRVQAVNEYNRMTGAHAAVKLDVTLQVRSSAQEWLQAVLEAIQSRLGLSDGEIESLLPHIPSMRLQGKELPIIDVERG